MFFKVLYWEIPQNLHLGFFFQKCVTKKVIVSVPIWHPFDMQCLTILTVLPHVETWTRLVFFIDIQWPWNHVCVWSHSGSGHLLLLGGLSHVLPHAQGLGQEQGKDSNSVWLSAQIHQVLVLICKSCLHLWTSSIAKVTSLIHSWFSIESRSSPRLSSQIKRLRQVTELVLVYLIW